MLIVIPPKTLHAVVSCTILAGIATVTEYGQQIMAVQCPVQMQLCVETALVTKGSCALLVGGGNIPMPRDRDLRNAEVSIIPVRKLGITNLWTMWNCRLQHVKLLLVYFLLSHAPHHPNWDPACQLL